MAARHQGQEVTKSQFRIETSQAQLGSTVTQSHALLERSQELNVSAASALQESQIRIENQLQQILEVQSRHSNPVLSGSLDVSSPEGRQTWMELGRLLREEGITPNIISKNKGLLIQAMKKSIKNLSDSPDAASYKTALEYQSFSSSANMSLRPHSSLGNSMSSLELCTLPGSDLFRILSCSLCSEASASELSRARRESRGRYALFDRWHGRNWSY